MRTREALKPSVPFRARFGCQPDSLRRFYVPKDSWRSSQPCATPQPRREERAPRLPMPSEDDSFTRLATSLTTVHSPKTVACLVHDATDRSLLKR